MYWGMQPFDEPPRKAYAEGKLSKERPSEMVRRHPALDVRGRDRRLGTGQW